tara:strand:- start:1750 stop:1878 length:129 start_codon:yes stop_codon:yes gene_type:complete
MDEHGHQIASLFVEKLGDEFLLDKGGIEERKRELERENLDGI